jgi:predicted nuclease with RNAse H fold
MRTLGIDLAAQEAKTAACVIEWGPDRALIAELRAGGADRELLSLVAGADKVGVDAPFGWPDEFVEAVSTYHRGGGWGRRGGDPAALRTRLAWRDTDRFVAEQAPPCRPLSVSTDRIGVTAMRCAHLLDRLAELAGPVDRSGSGKMVEVYPAAALRRWDLQFRGYKQAKGRAGLERVLESLERAAPWLTISNEERAVLSRSDDASVR